MLFDLVQVTVYLLCTLDKLIHKMYYLFKILTEAVKLLVWKSVYLYI